MGKGRQIPGQVAFKHHFFSKTTVAKFQALNCDACHFGDDCPLKFFLISYWTSISHVIQSVFLRFIEWDDEAEESIQCHLFINKSQVK